jgi:hypothetical protein
VSGGIVAGAPDVETSRRLARLAVKYGLPRVFHAVGGTGFRGQPSASVPADGPAQVTDRSQVDLRVGIWQPTVTGDGLTFVRAPNADEWPGAWSERGEIGPKRGPRVVLIGESVARGMHHDPYYNPAIELERRLRAMPGLDDCEVVDVARIDGTLDYLLRTLPLSLQLEPDVIVVMAGNNWRHHLLSSDGVLRPAAELDAVEPEAMCDAVGAYVEMVERCRAIADVAVVHVLPDFNLVDWTPAFLWATPPLPDPARLRWTRTCRVLRDAFESGDASTAVELADDLAAIDGGGSAVAPFVSGRLHLAAGELDNARRCLEAAADRTVVPRCSRALQRELRAAAAGGAFELVDLPLALARRRGGALGDRKVFLDYCHHTVHGIKLVADTIAGRVAPLLGLVRVPSDDACGPDLDGDGWPGPDVEGVGHLCGAIYSGRFHQGYEIVRHHAERAFELAPYLVDQARSFLDHNSAATPKGLSPAYQRLLETPFGVVQQRLSVPKANRAVMEALDDAIKAAQNRPTDRELEALLRRDHDVDRDGGRDVLFSTFWVRGGQARRGHRTFFSCYEPELRVDFYCGRATDLAVDVSYRVPGEADPDDDVELWIGTHRIAQAEAGSGWRRLRVVAPSCVVGRGVSQLRIRWPESGAVVVPTQPFLVRGDVQSLRIGPAVG